MKYFKIFALILAVALLFSGCSFRLASSVDELISPVSPQGDDAEIQNALVAYAGGGFKLKSPVAGNYTAAYNLVDADGDSQNEAVVFYEPAQHPGRLDMAVIDKKENKWSVVTNIETDNAEVYSLDFADLNGNGDYEYIILWNAMANATIHSLCVYSSAEDGSGALSQIGKTIVMNNYIAADLNNDSVNELAVFTIDSGDSVSASAVLYSYYSGDAKILGRTKLDGHISYYKTLSSAVKNGRTYVYADAVKSNGTQMLTEIIYWSDKYNTIISPYYSYTTGITKNTTRYSMLSCMDINGDGEIEIPLDYDFYDLPENVYAVEWNKYDGNVMSPVCCSLAVEKDEYQLVIPDELIGNITAEYNAEDSKLTVLDSAGNMIFAVACVTSTHYAETAANYSNYTEIMNESGYIYLADCNSQSDVRLSAEDLKSMIKSY